jgi:hypothetical protein
MAVCFLVICKGMTHWWSSLCLHCLLTSSATCFLHLQHIAQPHGFMRFLISLRVRQDHLRLHTGISTHSIRHGCINYPVCTLKSPSSWSWWNRHGLFNKNLNEPDVLEYDPALQLIQDEAPAAPRSWIMVRTDSPMPIDAHHGSLAQLHTHAQLLLWMTHNCFFEWFNIVRHTPLGKGSSHPIVLLMSSQWLAEYLFSIVKEESSCS